MASESFFQKHYYLLRRLHSLAGIVPIGVFMLVHLTTNASVVWGMLDSRAQGPGLHAGVHTFQHEVNFIHSLPALILIEVFGLWLPIAFHAVLGVYYAQTGQGNTGQYRYQSNRRYALQRLSGYVGVLFLFYHVATLRWGWNFLIPGGTQWSGEYAASTLASAMRGGTGEHITGLGMLVSSFYMLGVSLLVFHLVNGLWTAAITWGLTITRTAQQRWGYVCAGLGAGLMLLAWSAVIGFATLDVKKAKKTEEHMLGGAAVEAQDQRTVVEPRLREWVWQFAYEPVATGTPLPNGGTFEPLPAWRNRNDEVESRFIPDLGPKRDALSSDVMIWRRSPGPEATRQFIERLREGVKNGTLPQQEQPRPAIDSSVNTGKKD